MASFLAVGHGMFAAEWNFIGRRTALHAVLFSMYRMIVPLAKWRLN